MLVTTLIGVIGNLDGAFGAFEGVGSAGVGAFIGFFLSRHRLWHPSKQHSPELGQSKVVVTYICFAVLLVTCFAQNSKSHMVLPDLNRPCI